MFESSLLVRVPGSGTNMTYRIPCSDVVGLFISSVWGRVGETRGHGVALALAHQDKLMVYVGSHWFSSREPMSSPGPTFSFHW